MGNRESTATRRLSGEKCDDLVPERSLFSRMKNTLKAVTIFSTFRVEKSNPDQARWVLKRGWDSNVMDRPAGFPANPWVLYSPETHHLYLSKSCQETPPADQWYHYQQDQEPTEEPDITVEILAGNRVRVIDTRESTATRRLSGEKCNDLVAERSLFSRMKNVLKAVNIFSTFRVEKANPAEALSEEVERATLAVPETDELSESEAPPLESSDTVTEFELSMAAIQNDVPSEETNEVTDSEISPPKSKDAVIRLKRKKTTIELKVSFAQIRLGSEQTKVSYAQVCHKRVVARKRTAMRNKQKRTPSMWLRDNQRLVASTSREPREFVRFGRRVAPHRATPAPGADNIRKTKRLRVKGGFGSTQKRFGKASSRLRMWR